MWRDLGAFILLIKTLFSRHQKFSNPVLVFLSFFLLYVICFFLIAFWKGEEMAIPIFRWYFDGICLTLALSTISMNDNSLRKIIRSIAIVTFILGISGIIQYFFIREYFHVFMDHYTINPYGRIALDSVSSTIMGFERMTGFVAAPNAFGVLMACFLTVLIAIYSLCPKKMSILQKIFLLIIILLGSFCLILSFSRAGWAIFTISFVLILCRKGKFLVLAKYLSIAFFLVVSIVTFAVSIFPEVLEIINDTFTGEEDSVGMRPISLNNAWHELLKEPFGYGVGASRRDYGVYAESSVLNIAYDLGIQGIVFLYIMWIFFYIKILTNGKHLAYIVTSPIFLASIVICFVSVNPFEAPYIFLLWSVIGIGLNPSFKNKKNVKKSISYNSYI
jgi:hypothetical protein